MLVRLMLTATMAMAVSHASARVADGAAVARLARAAMAATGAKGLAVAVVDDGRVVSVGAWGARNAAGDPLTTDTVMYGASLTKAVVGYTTMQLVEAGKLTLDTPVAALLDRPLPDYPDDDRYAAWSGLKGDERWRRLTPRILLEHGSGFANFGFLEPDQRLRIHFEPGSRYSYSGDGLILLQFALERGLRLDLGTEMRARAFAPLGMTRTSMSWRDDFAGNLADGWDASGKAVEHDRRERVRAAGSMDTTIADIARFVAAYVRGDRLSPAGRAELTRPQLPITTSSQFPTLQDALPPAQRHSGLAAGLGVVTFTGPQGRGFFKGGHNDTTANLLVCLEARRRCVVILSNDVRAETAYPGLVDAILGATGLPWTWEYAPAG